MRCRASLLPSLLTRVAFRWVIRSCRVLPTMRGAESLLPLVNTNLTFPSILFQVTILVLGRLIETVRFSPEIFITLHQTTSRKACGLCLGNPKPCQPHNPRDPQCSSAYDNRRASPEPLRRLASPVPACSGDE